MKRIRKFMSLSDNLVIHAEPDNHLYLQMTEHGPGIFAYPKEPGPAVTATTFYPLSSVSALEFWEQYQ